MCLMLFAHECQCNCNFLMASTDGEQVPLESLEGQLFNLLDPCFQRQINGSNSLFQLVNKVLAKEVSRHMLPNRRAKVISLKVFISSNQWKSFWQRQTMQRCLTLGLAVIRFHEQIKLSLQTHETGPRLLYIIYLH